MAQCTFSTKPKRGCPDSASFCAKKVLEGVPITETGRLQFPDGSFANGGAMKIAPVGLAFRSAPSASIREASRLAILSTHVHPEAVDGAAIIAACIAFLTKVEPSELDVLGLLAEATAVCETASMKEKIEI